MDTYLMRFVNSKNSVMRKIRSKSTDLMMNNKMEVWRMCSSALVSKQKWHWAWIELETDSFVTNVVGVPSATSQTG